MGTYHVFITDLGALLALEQVFEMYYSVAIQ